jgi:soluble lytic murein transglycosylase-like protein
MEPVDSSLISERGYDPAKKIMQIRFTNKTFKFGVLYEYGNISPAVYAEACAWVSDRTGELSFGQFFQKFIKPNERQYPFRKLEDPHNGWRDDLPVTDPDCLPTPDNTATTIDFESGGPLPATTLAPEPSQNPDELMAEAEALAKRTKEIGEVRGNAILIASPEAAALAMTTGMAIARMRDALERTMRPKIKDLYAPYKAALEILNRYDKPLEEDQNRLRAGLAAYHQEQKRLRDVEEARLRKIQEDQAEEEARHRAEELQLEDAVAAESRGETELAEQIIAAPALPIAPILPAPVRVATAMPSVAGVGMREKWQWEVTDESKIPREYFVLDRKAIDAVVSRTKGRANTLIPGIRAYDAGTASFSKK